MLLTPKQASLSGAPHGGMRFAFPPYVLTRLPTPCRGLIYQALKGAMNCATNLLEQSLMSLRFSQNNEKAGRAGVPPAILVRGAHPTFKLVPKLRLGNPPVRQAPAWQNLQIISASYGARCAPV